MSIYPSVLSALCTNVKKDIERTLIVFSNMSMAHRSLFDRPNERLKLVNDERSIDSVYGRSFQKVGASWKSARLAIDVLAPCSCRWFI